jgi:hypothetical protein
VLFLIDANEPAFCEFGRLYRYPHLAPGAQGKHHQPTAPLALPAPFWNPPPMAESRSQRRLRILIA